MDTRKVVPLVARNARSQLVELLQENPALLAEVREMVGGNESVSEAATDEPRSAVFDGESTEKPIQSKTGKSLKYEVECWIGDPEDGPKALIVAYLPPEVATKTILVTVVAEGQATIGRARKVAS